MSETITFDNNVGDVALNFKPSDRREDIINAEFLRYNIFPGDLINKNKPTENYQFAWGNYKDEEWNEDIMDLGYQPVVEAEWTLKRFQWNTPPVDQLRWSGQRHLVKRGEFLMYRNEELYRREQAKRLKTSESQLEGLYSQGIEDGLRHGLSVEGAFAGKPIDVRAPARRHSVS